MRSSSSPSRRAGAPSPEPPLEGHPDAATPREAAAFPRYFGVAHVGAIRGLVMSLSVGGTAFGPPVLALGFERFGTYGPALSMLLVLPLAVAVAAVFAPLPDVRMRARIRGRMLERAEGGPRGGRGSGAG